MISAYFSLILFYSGTPFAAHTDVIHMIRDSPVHWNVRENLKQKKKYVAEKLL